MSDVWRQPFIYGLAGSFIFATGRLISAVFGESGKSDVKKAFAMWGLAVFFGPFAAQAFEPTLFDYLGSHLRPQAISFGIGLVINIVWPMIERFIPKRLKAALENLGSSNE